MKYIDHDVLIHGLLIGSDLLSTDKPLDIDGSTLNGLLYALTGDRMRINNKYNNVAHRKANINLVLEQFRLHCGQLGSVNADDFIDRRCCVCDWCRV